MVEPTRFSRLASFPAIPRLLRLSRLSRLLQRRRFASASVVVLLATLMVLPSPAAAATALARDVDWVRTGGSDEFDYGRGIAIDPAGNTYIAIQVGGQATFTDALSSLTTTAASTRPAIAVVKYSPAGSLVWLRSITSTAVALQGGLSLDSGGDLLVTGTFVADVSFGDPPNDLTVTGAPNRNTAFVVRYDADGTVQWTRSVTASAGVSAAGIAAGPNGIAFSATFAGTASLTAATTAGTGGSTNVTATGTRDLLVARLDASGNAEWVTSVPSETGAIEARSIATNAAGDMVVAGSYTGSVTWGTTAGSPTTSARAHDAFVLSLDPAGARRWVHAPGSAANDQGWAAAIDPSGTHVTIGGYVGGTATFGSGPSAVTVAPATSPSAFITRFDVITGATTFARTVLGPGPSIGTSVWVTATGESVLGGIFAGPVVFGGTPPIAMTSSQLGGFVTTFDSDGRATAGFTPTGTSVAALLTFGVAMSSDGTIVSTGALRGSMTFTGRNGSLVASDTEGNADAYVVRMPMHVNHAPAADALELSTISDVARPVTLTGTDPDGDVVTLAVDGPGPAHGSLSGVAPNFVYTPDAGYRGPDAFAYTATDPEGLAATASVSISVIDPDEPPVATAATVLTTRNRATPIVLQGSDAGANPLAYAIEFGPSHGTLAGTPPNVVFTPSSDFLGADSFTFSVRNDRGQASTAAITITVKQPNVVVIMTDDQTLEQQRWLPRTNALLGAEGTTFTNFVVSYSECCPSRATLLTGQYAHNHGVLSSALPTGGVSLFDHANSLAPWLQANGYYTALSGKYMNGYGTDLPPTFVPPGWDDWHALYEPTTYEYFNYDISVNGITEHHARRASDYSTDVLANRVDQQIRAHGGTDQPFFMAFTPTAPHVTLRGLAGIAAPRHAGTLVGATAPRTPSFNSVNASLPAFVRLLPAFTADAITGIDNIYRVDAEAMLAVDEAVEKIYDALRDTGELDNTIIVFTSDNGLHFGDRRMVNSKSDPYEETLRVPLVVRGPGFPAGAVVNQPTANIDLAPTITAATGTTPGRVADGVSLTNFVADPGYGVHRTVITENGPLLGRRMYKGIRDDRWVYIAWSTGEKELYDLATDPYEMENLVHVPARQLQVLSLDKKLRDLQPCAGATCRSGLP